MEEATGRRDLLRHFLAALAYRTQKALRGAPAGFGEFRAAPGVRTPRELVRHMSSVLGYARTHFIGGSYRAEALPELEHEVSRLHRMLEQLAGDLAGSDPKETTLEQLLQGPMADAMTHAGQLALLRRLAGTPVAPENFIRADIAAGRYGADQAAPTSPDREWLDAEGRPQD